MCGLIPSDPQIPAGESKIINFQPEGVLKTSRQLLQALSDDMRRARRGSVSQVIHALLTQTAAAHCVCTETFKVTFHTPAHWTEFELKFYHISRSHGSLVKPKQ